MTTSTKANQAVAILATMIGQKDASFFQRYFENGLTLTVYTHEGYTCVVDHTGMCVVDNGEQVFGSFQDRLDYAKMNNAKNPFEACKAKGESMVINS